MEYPHPQNGNLTLTDQPFWHGFALIPEYAPYVTQYLTRTFEVLGKAIENNRRLTVVRFDLRLPNGMKDPGPGIITRFVESLQSQVDADQAQKDREGKRGRHCRVRYIWTREQDRSESGHYHVAIMVNRDAYRFLGGYPASNGYVEPPQRPGNRTLADMIVRAWARALDLINVEEAIGCVHFCRNGVYWLDANGPTFSEQLKGVFYRLSYFAKADTKHYGDGAHSFGSSRK